MNEELFDAPMQQQDQNVRDSIERHDRPSSGPGGQRFESIRPDTTLRPDVLTERLQSFRLFRLYRVLRRPWCVEKCISPTFRSPDHPLPGTVSVGHESRNTGESIALRSTNVLRPISCAMEIAGCWPTAHVHSDRLTKQIYFEARRLFTCLAVSVVIRSEVSIISHGHLSMCPQRVASLLTYTLSRRFIPVAHFDTTGGDLLERCDVKAAVFGVVDQNTPDRHFLSLVARGVEDAYTQ
jgi:hypothetical protein